MKNCRHCSGALLPGRRTGLCSPACALARAAAYYARVEAPREEDFRRCPCGETFDAVRANQTYCSSTCLNRAKRARERKRGTRESTHRERARRFGRRYQPIRPQDVFERDRWICQLCRKPVQRDKKAPHPMSPTLDHIIPMSVEGGDHVPENVHTAHFICNSTRGTGGTVQLLLIG